MALAATLALTACNESQPPSGTRMQGLVESGSCDEDADCDDNNSCTSDYCDAEGQCHNDRSCCNTEVCTINEIEGRRDIYPAFFNNSPCEHAGFGIVGRNWSRDAPAPGWTPWTETGYEWGNHGRAYDEGGEISRTGFGRVRFTYRCCVHGEEGMAMPQSAIDANNAEAARELSIGGFIGQIPDMACEALCGGFGQIVYRLPNLVNGDGVLLNNGHNSNTDGHRTENMIYRALANGNPLPKVTASWCSGFCGMAPSTNMATCTY